MVDAFISTTTLSNLVQAAVDRYVRAALRHAPLLRGFADTRPVQVDKPGSSVALYVYSDLAPATTPINETVDPDFVAMGNPTAVTVTLNEYGNASLASARVKNFSFSNIDPAQMDQIAYNMRDSMDVLVREVLSLGTNVTYGGNATSTVTVDGTDVIDSTDIRTNVAFLRGAAVQGRVGDMYVGLIHPYVSVDLRTESGAAGWRDSHIYAAPGLIWPGSIGHYEGAHWIETARTKVANDGATSEPVYRTLILGREALAEAVAVEPHVTVGVVPDRLNRFYPLGWTGILGWARFREAALRRIETASSLT